MQSLSVEDICVVLKQFNVPSDNHATSVIVQKFQVLCNKYKLDKTSLSGELEAHVNNSGDIPSEYDQQLQFTAKFELQLQKNKDAAERHKQMGVENNVPNIKRQKIEDTSSKVSKSTHTNSIDRTFKTSSQSFAERSGPGNQVVGYKQDKFSTRGDIELSDTRPLGLRCKIDWNLDDFNNINSRYRYMFTTIDERARALDKHLLRLQNHFCGVLQIPIEDLQPVGTSSQETVWVCGRICCDTAQGKLNDKSVQLEGCRRDGGRRVLLKLDQNLPYSLFPGQIVLAEGVCSTGREFVAKRVISNIPQPRLQVDPNDLLKFQYSKSFQGGAPLSLVVAVGPFTTSDNLEYEPLRVLLGKMLEDKPDVLVLVGPFVDASHPSIADGLAKLVNEDTNVEKILSYEMIFIKKIIMEGLEQLFVEEPDIPTNIILIPSLLDAHHEHVFPQAPFGDRDPVDTPFYEERLGTLDVPFSKDSDVRKRVHLLPNPCMFRVNETVFGVTSNDVLFSMQAEEISNVDGERLIRLASHLVYQQSFLPQFPPPSNMVSQMDFRNMKGWQMPSTPDILITPSRLKPFAMEGSEGLSETLVINPGYLSKGTTGGTFAQINIHPIDRGVIQTAVIENKSVSNQVPSRTSVNILKI